MEVNVDSLSIPSRIHDVDNPVPVPNSRNLPPGFELARVRSKEHVNTSDAIVKPDDRVDSSMAA